MAVSPSSTDELLVEQHDRVAVFTLNRPDRLNAISRDMLEELSAKMVEANKDPDTRCIVLTGAGKGFCSGLDLVAVGEGGIGSGEGAGSNRPRQLFDLRDAPINVMWNIDTPIVCAVGYASFLQSLEAMAAGLLLTTLVALGYAWKQSLELVKAPPLRELATPFLVLAAAAGAVLGFEALGWVGQLPWWSLPFLPAVVYVVLLLAVEGRKITAELRYLLAQVRPAGE